MVKEAVHGISPSHLLHVPQPSFNPNMTDLTQEHVWHQTHQTESMRNTQLNSLHLSIIWIRYPTDSRRCLKKSSIVLKTPFIEEDGNLQGVYVKVKNPCVRNLINQGGINLKCTIKLTCAYFTRDRCGLSFELVTAYTS